MVSTRCGKHAYNAHNGCKGTARTSRVSQLVNQCGFDKREYRHVTGQHAQQVGENRKSATRTKTQACQILDQ
jgi:hypothetical protein